MLLESDKMDKEKTLIKIKDIRLPFYFEYLNIDKIDKKYHIVYIDSESFKLLIPNNYQIDYLRSINSNDRGHLSFSSNKHIYTLDYMKMQYSEFIEKINNLKGSVNKSFINYRGQKIYEVVKDNVDYLYMYYNNYFYKLYGNHKFTINEYFDMYFVLFSVTNRDIDDSINHIRDLCYLQEQGIYYLCNDLDLLLTDLSNYSDSIEIKKEDLIIVKDEAYLQYKETQNKAKLIALKVLEPNKEDLSLYENDNIWYILGSFSFGILGNFNYGYIDEFNEINNSEELSYDEKKDLLNELINQRQLEVASNSSEIKMEFYKYLVNYFINNMSYQLWSEYHIREFVNIDYLTGNEDNVNDNIIYSLFINKLEEDDDCISLFDKKMIEDSIVSEKIVIYPNRYIIRFSALNCLLKDKECTFDETYKLCCDYC